MWPLAFSLTLGLLSLTPLSDARPQRNLILTYEEGEGTIRYYSDGTDVVFALFSSNDDLIDCDIGRLNGTVAVFEEAVSGRPKSAEYEVYDIRMLARQCRRYLRKMMRLKDTDKLVEVQQMAKRIDLHMGYPGTDYCMTTKPLPVKKPKVTKEGTATNKCCKALHNCKTGIPASVLHHGLFNYYAWDAYGCDCTQKFKTCLHQVNNDLADNVGSIYFDLLNVKCIKLDHSKTCTRHDAWYNKCKESTIGKKAKFVSSGKYREEKSSM